MANHDLSLASLTDADLLTRVKVLADEERHATAALIAALVELDARRLFLGQGYPSLFEYCRKELRLSEDAAYNRLRAARVASKWPIVLEMIANGSLSITAVRLLSGVLTDSNHDELLLAASGKSKRDVEEIIAALHPQPAIPPSIRKLSDPAGKPESSTVVHAPLLAAPPQPPPVVKPACIAPLSLEQYKVQFTISRATHDKLRRVQDLMRHAHPNGDPAAIFDRALTALLEQLERAKLGRATRPLKEQRGTGPGSRHVPSAVKRQVWARDGGRCAFLGTVGRCTETGFLEYHHVVPHADGGETSASNIQLRCRAHNVYESEEWFGPMVVRERQAPYGFGRAHASQIR